MCLICITELVAGTPQFVAESALISVADFPLDIKQKKYYCQEFENELMIIGVQIPNSAPFLKNGDHLNEQEYFSRKCLRDYL